MTFDWNVSKRICPLIDISARLLCGVAISALAAAPVRAEDGKIRILTLNIWNQFKQTPGVTADFMTAGNFDVLAFQEANGSRYVSDIPGILQNAGLGTYGGIQIGDVGLISRLPGTYGTYTLPGIPTQGRYISYTVAGEDDGRPATLIGTVHLDYSDQSDKRIAEAKALNAWAKGSVTPIILTGDFNAGDVSERGLHSANQQATLYARYITDTGASSLWKKLAQEYVPQGREAEFQAYFNDMRSTGTDGVVKYRNVLTDYFNSHRGEFPGLNSISDMSWRQWEEILAKDMTAKGLTFVDETYPVADNLPQTMNILKKQYMVLQTEAERERFAPHGLNDGSGTWPSAGEDKTNTWESWDRVKIDHFLAARPFGKWYAIDDDPNDAYAGVIKDVYVTKPDGTRAPLSDHEPVSHTFKWIGPALETYTETVNNANVDKTRLVWGSDAPTFGEKGGEFYLTRNNMRTDVYLGQISDANGKPIFTDLTDQEKKTLLDCKSADPRFQQAIAEYCIDDHSFIGETLVKDAGTVVVDEDAALGGSAASLRLDNGTLRIAGTAMRQLDRSVVLEAGGGSIDVADASNAVAINRIVSGVGSLTKLGKGALALSAANTYTGETLVKTGRLIVNGSIASSSLTTVFDGGTIAGNGTVGNLKIGAGGTIAPGNSIGTLNVAGDLTFAKGSIYQAEVDMEGNRDLVTVTGKTTIEGGTVMSIAANGGYKPETNYTIINSAGGIDGAFDAVISNFAFLNPNLTYGAANIKLALERNDTAFNDVAGTFNQRSAARGAESLGYGTSLYDAIVMLDATTARSAFTQIGGEVHASTYGVLIDNSHFVRDAMAERLRAASGELAGQDMSVLGLDAGGPRPTAATTDLFAVWGKSFGSWADGHGDGNAAGLTDATGGMLVGADGAFGDTWRIGLLAGYSRTSVSIDSLASSSDSDNFDLGVYAGTRAGPLALRFGAAYTWHSIDTIRGVSIPSLSERLTSGYNASTAQVFGEASYRFDLTQGAFEPFANLAYVHFNNDGFSERGGVTALDGRDGNLDTLFTTLGIRASGSVDIGDTVATLHGTLGWQHAEGDDVPSSVMAFSGGDAFTIRGTPVADDVAIVRAGVDFAVTSNATLGIAYSGQFGSGLSDNGITGHMSIRF